MVRILLTKVAGFIGSHLAEKLLSKGHEVMGVICFTDYYPYEIFNIGGEARIPINKTVELLEDITKKRQKINMSLQARQGKAHLRGYLKSKETYGISAQSWYQRRPNGGSEVDRVFVSACYLSLPFHLLISDLSP